MPVTPVTFSSGIHLNKVVPVGGNIQAMAPTQSSRTLAYLWFTRGGGVCSSKDVAALSPWSHLSGLGGKVISTPKYTTGLTAYDRQTDRQRQRKRSSW